MTKDIKSQQKVSILFIAKSFSPNIGGVEKHLYKLSNELVRQGFRVTILTERTTPKLQLEEVVSRVHVVRIPIGDSQRLKKFFIWKWMLLHPQFLLDYDVVHVHDVFYYLLPFRLLIFWKKIYITFHGYEGYPVKVRWIVLRKIAEKLTNGNICIGKFMEKWYFTLPSTVSYGAVSLDAKNKKAPLQSAVFFGRLDDQTGILEYVDAYKKIKEKYPKFQFTVVGEGDLRTKISKDITVVKFTDNVESFISQHHFVFVSRYLSMLEALVQKREIIATYDNPIKKDYLMMSPFKKYISIAKDSDEIADFVIGGIKNPDRNNARNENGRKWATSQSWQNMAATYLRLWKL